MNADMKKLINSLLGTSMTEPVVTNRDENAERKRYELRYELVEQNKSAFDNWPNETFFVKKDSTLRKNTAFIKKLKEQLIREFDALNLTKYIDEVAAAIVEAKVKSTDIPFLVKLCSTIHQRYSQFHVKLFEAWTKCFAERSTNEASNVVNLSKFRVDLFFYADSVSVGLFDGNATNQSDAVKALGNQLIWLTESSSAVSANGQPSASLASLNVVIGFCRHCADEWLGVWPHKIRLFSEKYNQPLPRSPTVKNSAAFIKLFNTYLTSCLKALDSQLKQARSAIKNNQHQLEQTGQITTDQQQRSDQLIAGCHKLADNLLMLSDLLDVDPSLVPNVDKIIQAASADQLEDGAQSNGDDESSSCGFFDDDDACNFYQNFPDLKAMLPGILVKEGDQSGKIEKEKEAAPPEDQEGDVSQDIALEQLEAELALAEQEQEEPAPTESKVLELDDTPADSPTTTGRHSEKFFSTPSKDDKSDLGGVDKSNPSGKVLIEAFLIKLPNSINRDLVDQAATDFGLNLNTKLNRRRLGEALFDIPHNRHDLIPFYCRLLAILGPIAPDLVNDVTGQLESNFHRYVSKKDQLHLQSKLKVVRFIGELVKFRLFSGHKALACLKRLLPHFSHHNLQMACTLLDTCGRFLYRQPLTSRLTKLYLEVMMRKKTALRLDEQQAMLVDNAYHTCMPPTRTGSRLPKVILTVEMKYLHHLITSLKNSTLSSTFIAMRRIDWSDKKLVQYLEGLLTRAWEIRFSDLNVLAILVRNLGTYHESFCLDVVDNVLEDIRIGMEVNSFYLRHRRTCMVTYLGHLYNYSVINSATIFSTLYSLLTFGVSLDPNNPSTLDPPDDLFRIVLICTLLNTVGSYFEAGVRLKKLSYFLIYFQHYYWAKRSHPLWIQPTTTTTTTTTPIGQDNANEQQPTEKTEGDATAKTDSQKTAQLYFPPYISEQYEATLKALSFALHRVHSLADAEHLVARVRHRFASKLATQDGGDGQSQPRRDMQPISEQDEDEELDAAEQEELDNALDRLDKCNGFVESNVTNKPQGATLNADLSMEQEQGVVNQVSMVDENTDQQMYDGNDDEGDDISDSDSTSTLVSDSSSSSPSNPIESAERQAEAELSIDLQRLLTNSTNYSFTPTPTTTTVQTSKPPPLVQQPPTRLPTVSISASKQPIGILPPTSVATTVTATGHQTRPTPSLPDLGVLHQQLGQLSLAEDAQPTQHRSSRGDCNGIPTKPPNDTVPFRLITRRGGAKPQLIPLAVPKTVDFAAQLVARQDAERREKAQVKNKVLQMHHAQRQEEYEAVFKSTVGQSDQNTLTNSIPANINRYTDGRSGLSPKVMTYNNEVPSKYQNSMPISSMLFLPMYFIDRSLFENSAKRFLGEHRSISRIKQLQKSQASLPIAAHRQEILTACSQHQVVLVAGDTGCGKSTQMPQYLHLGQLDELTKLPTGQLAYQRIAVTQPRRIACVSLAARVSSELLNELGSKVAYQVRFEQSRTKATKILFLTEGLLLRQIQADPLLTSYDVIILDEVHERHWQTDCLLGLLKCLVKARPEVKVVLMSATINVNLFSAFFDNCPIIKVPGRLFPIDLRYMPLTPSESADADRIDPQPYLRLLSYIDSKYSASQRGDMLVFLPGMADIQAILEPAKAYADQTKRWIILPLHSTLSANEQDKVFHVAPDGVRKCILSTNIAETSLTIDGIRFVADSGRVKELSWDSSARMRCLKQFALSKASADQRKGRAGRTGPGVCFRFYSQDDYEAFMDFSIPEIRRVPLETLVLQMLVMGLPDIQRFPFIEPPTKDSLSEAVNVLKMHGALEPVRNPSNSNNRRGAMAVSDLGCLLADLPVDFALGRMLIGSAAFNLTQPVLTLVAGLAVQSPLQASTSRHEQVKCLEQLEPYESNHGDPFTLLAVFEEWLQVKAEYANPTRHSHDRVDDDDDPRSTTSVNPSRWCRRLGVQEQRLHEMVRLRAQFSHLLQSTGLVDSSSSSSLENDEASRDNRRAVKRSIDQARRRERLQTKRKRLLTLQSENNNSGEESGDDDENALTQGDQLRAWIKSSMSSSKRPGGRVNLHADDVSVRDLELVLCYNLEQLASQADASRMNEADLTLLKVVLTGGLYPHLALGDPSNAYRASTRGGSAGPGAEMMFHTKTKSFVNLHPNDVFVRNPDVLFATLDQSDDVDAIAVSNQKPGTAFANNHQLLVYMDLLETTKPYLVNTFRVVALPTLLLYAKEIDVNYNGTRIVFDRWLEVCLLDVEAAQRAIAISIWLRTLLQQLTSIQLAECNRRRSQSLVTTTSDEVGGSSMTPSSTAPRNQQSPLSTTCRQLRRLLSHSLASFLAFNSGGLHSLKRLVAVDVKRLYRPDKSREIQYGELDTEAKPASDSNLFEAGSIDVGVFFTSQSLSPTNINSNFDLITSERLSQETAQMPPSSSHSPSNQNPDPIRIDGEKNGYRITAYLTLDCLFPEKSSSAKKAFDLPPNDEDVPGEINDSYLGKSFELAQRLWSQYARGMTACDRTDEQDHPGNTGVDAGDDEEQNLAICDQCQQPIVGSGSASRQIAILRHRKQCHRS